MIIGLIVSWRWGVCQAGGYNIYYLYDECLPAANIEMLNKSKNTQDFVKEKCLCL